MHIKTKKNKGWTTSRSNNLNFYSTVGSYVPLYEVATSPLPATPPTPVQFWQYFLNVEKN